MNKLIIIGNVFLIFSMLFIFPFEQGMIFADRVSQQQIISTEEGVRSTCGEINIRNSVIMSAFTLCLPGVLEGLEKEKQIRCEEVVCKYTAISNGLPTLHCSKQRAYRVCEAVYGELFALPGFNAIQLIEGIKDIIAASLADPYVATLTTLRISKSSCIDLGFCSFYNYLQPVGDYILNTNDFIASIQNVINIFDNGFAPVRGPDYCEQVEDLGIEAEVNQILGISEE